VIYTMSDIDELMALRPLVSQLRHDLEHERRRSSHIQQRLDAEIVLSAQLRLQLSALRDASLSTETPPMGSGHVSTDAIFKKDMNNG